MPILRPYYRISYAATLVILVSFIPGLFAPGHIPAAHAATTAPMGLHVAGQQLLDGSNSPVILRGVDRSGTEYACIQGWGFFDGPSDSASRRQSPPGEPTLSGSRSTRIAG
jgi:hypothetical protein